MQIRELHFYSPTPFAFRQLITVMENCDVPHTIYVSVSKTFVTNILFPGTIITSDQSFAVGVQIILGFSEETDAHISHGLLPL